MARIIDQCTLVDTQQEETKVREEAEREVRRLKGIVEGKRHHHHQQFFHGFFAHSKPISSSLSCCSLIIGNNNPVISSCRAESQAYVRELKDAHEQTKQELRFEKDKNAKLVSKALELEREKNALLAAQSAAAAPGLTRALEPL